MKNKEISMVDLLIETHVGLERQGPGGDEMTLKALSFIDDIDKIAHAADLGCGTGRQTMILAQNITGSIVGVDQFSDFTDIFNANAKKLNFGERVTAIVGDIYNLDFPKEEFDLIWSEGVIDNIGKGLNYWKDFIKPGGYMAVTCPSWFTDERPEEAEKFWSDADCKLDTVGNNVSTMQSQGFIPAASFALPEKCWTENYFIPREEAVKVLLEKYAGNKNTEDIAANFRYEAELYSKYKQHYGYVFYIGKKI